MVPDQSHHDHDRTETEYRAVSEQFHMVWVYRSPTSFSVVPIAATSRSAARAIAWNRYPRAYSISVAKK
jgi:hypothetical protein